MTPRQKRFWKIAPLAILGLVVFGFVVMYLWNWLVPDLFHGRTITYWQAWGIIILCKILFGGFSGRTEHGAWKHRLRARLERMTPEERERLLHGLRGPHEPNAPGQA
jgi:hypothetical protein